MLEHVINIIYESGKGHRNTIVVNQSVPAEEQFIMKSEHSAYR